MTRRLLSEGVYCESWSYGTWTALQNPRGSFLAAALLNGKLPRGVRLRIGAGEGTRTLDIDLGKVTLYQLSYAREVGREDSGEGTFTPADGHPESRRRGAWMPTSVSD